MLRIDGDCFSAGEVREIDAMCAAAETQIYAVVDQAFALAVVRQRLSLSAGRPCPARDAGPNALLHVLPAAIFEDDRLDAVKVQKCDRTRPAGPAPTMPTCVRMNSFSELNPCRR